ncbi:MAG TPA: polyprenyl synthetase family protein, partial [Chloroflexi bacterium]|nr:polyprenyl synthetase family protein [Chloroflexota bacterium]
EQFQPTGGRAGKRLRPVFCLLACEACGGEWERALPAAAAVELLHNFSLIHDDIEDNDRTRRGRPTLWALWGVPQALNAGDALYALAHLALLRLGGRGVPDGTVVAALGVFTRACLRLTEGQFLDISFETQEEVSPEAYLRMVEGKTAALLAAACELGALVAGAGPDRQGRLRDFGHHLGLAFQIQDDLLGIWGDPEVTGKPVGSDLIRRKKTLPILHGLQRSGPLRALLAQERPSPEDVGRAVELLEAAGSRAWAEERAREQTDRALAALEAAELRSPAADGLRQLALRLLGRVR